MEYRIYECRSFFDGEPNYFIDWREHPEHSWRQGVSLSTRERCEQYIKQVCHFDGSIQYFRAA